MRFDIRLIKSRYVANTGDRSVILYLFFPPFIFWSPRWKQSSGTLSLLWREEPLRAWGLGARLPLVCPSVADTLLAASFRSPLKQRGQQLHPLTSLARSDGCCLARRLDGGSFHGSNRWAWCCRYCRCPDTGRKTRLIHPDFQSQWTRTSITVDTGATITGSCWFFFQLGRETRQQAHILIQSECVWVWSLGLELEEMQCRILLIGTKPARFCGMRLQDVGANALMKLLHW